MAEFFELSVDERLEALAHAADASGRPPHLLEKDVWVVWSLRHLFAAPYAPHLIFKGGTSLSKVYGVVQRFSEDVDLTYVQAPTESASRSRHCDAVRRVYRIPPPAACIISLRFSRCVQATRDPRLRIQRLRLNAYGMPAQPHDHQDHHHDNLGRK